MWRDVYRQYFNVESVSIGLAKANRTTGFFNFKLITYETHHVHITVHILFIEY